ncbi:MAG TPA: Gmad2 immunoglobulin-like domain-containing protein [Acidimicrobiales bacterium]|jgi:hypothetical protein
MTATQSPRPALLPDDPDPGDRRWWLAIAATAAVIAVVAVVLVVRAGADGREVAVVGTVRSTTSTTAPPSTTETTAAGPATTAPPDTTAPPATAPPTSAPATPPSSAPPPTAVDLPTAIWPPTTGDVRFDDPAAVARSFAVYWLKMADPQVGAFRQGDARSGEVPLTPFADGGPETTVLVRQLTDDGSWWVTGAASEHIIVTAPTAGGVTSPVDLAGEAWAFEGTVQVGVYVQDSTAPIARTFVTGGGDQLRPFQGTVEFDPGAARYGAIAFAEYSENDGRILHATVVPVTFDAG